MIKENEMIKTLFIIMSALASLSMLMFVFVLKHGVNRASVLNRAKSQSDLPGK